MSTATPAPAHRRHDISDQAWETIAPHLSGGPGKVGRPAEDNRRFSNGVFWILRTGAPWRDLPPDYGHRTPPHTASGAGKRAASGPSCWLPYPMTLTLSG